MRANRLPTPPASRATAPFLTSGEGSKSTLDAATDSYAIASVVGAESAGAATARSGALRFGRFGCFGRIAAAFARGFVTSLALGAARFFRAVVFLFAVMSGLF